MVYTFKKIKDSDGIEYQEVSYKEYLDSPNKHRIVQSLQDRYFVEVDKEKQKEDATHKNCELPKPMSEEGRRLLVEIGNASRSLEQKGCGKEIEIFYAGLYLPSFICGEEGRLCDKCKKNAPNQSQGTKSADKSIDGLIASGTKSPIQPTTEQNPDTHIQTEIEDAYFGETKKEKTQ